jgi:hypothetical protein
VWGYILEVEREGKRSDYSCNYKGSWNNIHPESGEGKARGQITVMTAKEAGTMYTLEVERCQEVR